MVLTAVFSNCVILAKEIVNLLGSCFVADTKKLYTIWNFKVEGTNLLCMVRHVQLLCKIECVMELSHCH